MKRFISLKLVLNDKKNNDGDLRLEKERWETRNEKKFLFYASNKKWLKKFNKRKIKMKNKKRKEKKNPKRERETDREKEEEDESWD